MPEAKARRRSPRARVAAPLMGSAGLLAAATDLALSGRYYEAAVALAVAILLGEVGRRERRRPCA